MAKRIACSVPVEFFKEEDSFIAYCPVLDLSTCGKTFAEAQKRFAEILNMFIEDLDDRGTLGEVLESYGWHVKRIPTPHWVPPTIVGHIEQEATIPVPA